MPKELPICEKHGPHSGLGCPACREEFEEARDKDQLPEIPEYSSMKKWAESQLQGYLTEEDLEPEAHRLVKSFKHQGKDIRDFVMHEIMMEDKKTGLLECYFVWRLRL